METRHPRYGIEEHARRGVEIYEGSVRSKVEAGNHGKIVAIDIDSGDFELSPDMLQAAQLLIARRPEAQIWFVRVGHSGVHRFGAGRIAQSK